MRTAADLPEQLRDLIVSGRDAWTGRDYDRARALLTDALTRASEIDSTFGQAAALHFLGNVAFNRCHDIESRRLHSAALELSRSDGDDQGVATSLGSLAMIDAAEGAFDAAEANFAGAVDAYGRAGMGHAAEGMRKTWEALLEQHVPIDDLVHRQRWTEGTTIVRRDMWNGRPWYAAAAIVVEDSPRRLVSFTPDGSGCAIPATPGIFADMARGSWVLKEHARYNHTLSLYEPGTGYCIELFWKPDWDFIGWYVNLEDPFRRTPTGIDTCDLALDIVVAPDFSWHWKDEDDFAEMQERGLISAGRAAEIRANGERAIERIATRANPLNEQWPAWRPDSSWTVPRLPDGWEPLDSPAGAHPTA